MRFTIPQFIEYEAKIFGPFTFKQFIYVGLAGAACFLIYFLAPFSLFLISCIVLGGLALALAFLKIGGRSLPALLGNFFKFNISPKIYIWKKGKTSKTMVFKKEIKKKTKEIEEEELPLKIAEKSQLKKLQTQIETKTK